MSYGDSTEITADLELEDVTEEQWTQARTDSLVLAEAINRGLLDGDVATALQLEVYAEPEWKQRRRIRLADDAARREADAAGRRFE